jgi:hypothetical protein
MLVVAGGSYDSIECQQRRLLAAAFIKLDFHKQNALFSVRLTAA